MAWGSFLPTRGWTCTPCIGRLTLNPWTSMEVHARHYWQAHFLMRNRKVMEIKGFILVVQLLRCIRIFEIPMTAAYQAPLSSPSPRLYPNSCPLNQWCHPTISSSATLNLPQHQGLFQWVSFSHQVAKVLELQHQSFQWIFRTDYP